MHTTLRTLACTITLLIVGDFCRSTVWGSPRVRHHPAIAGTDFAQRWSWAQNAARQDGGGWIGYAIDLWMEPEHYLFSSGGFTIRHRSKSFRRGEVLADLLQARPAAEASPGVINSPQPDQIRRTVAVLVRLDAGGEIDDVDVTDLTFPADLEGLPLVWIGPAAADDSYRLLSGLYTRAKQARGREEVVQAVGLHERPEAVDFLARVLDSDDSVQVREEACEALAGQSEPRALQVLLHTARRDRSLDVREEAVEAIGESRVAGAAAALTDLARHGDSRRVRGEAVEALAEIATPDALATLRDILWHDDDVAVQEEALEALAERDTDDALPLLVEVARRHPRSAIRQEAVEALAEMAADRVVDTLEDLVYRDDSPAVREEALDALGELSGGEGIAVLVKVASTHPDRDLRQEALDALADASDDHPRARRALELLGSY